MVRMLVDEYEADPSGPFKQVGPDGKLDIFFALHYAAAAGFTSVVDFLVDECGISIDLLNSPYNLTSLHFTCTMVTKNGKEDVLLRMVKHLVEEKGANVLAQIRAEQTPRSIAHGAGNRRIAEYLEQKEKEVKEAAEAATEAARAAFLEELEAEEEKGKEGKTKGAGGGGGSGGDGSGGGSSKKKKKRSANNNNSKNKGSTAAAGGGGGGGAAAAGGGGAQAATTTTRAAAPAAAMAAMEESMEGLDLGEDEGKEQDRVVAKAEEAEEEEEGPGRVDDIQDEESFILEGAPNEFFCPITTALLVNPVLAADGVTYEEHAIREWFETCKRKGQEITSPKTGAKMADMTMPNISFRTLIKDFVHKKKEKYKRIRAEREASQGGARSEK